MSLKLGDRLTIQSYKHDTLLHRIWTQAKVLEHSSSHVVIANKRTRVIEANGRFWHTREPSVVWFYKDHWFNIIGMLRKDGVYYYCNIASPYIIDDEALKYIDYDLDIKVFPNGSYKVLDRGEYNMHKKKMDYPEKLRAILETELDKLKDMVEKRMGPFQVEEVKRQYAKFHKKVLKKQ